MLVTCQRFGDYVGNWDTPPPLKNADVLNGWSLCLLSMLMLHVVKVDTILGLHIPKQKV